MDPLEKYRISPIGEGSVNYEVYEQKTKEVVFEHPTRAWGADWLIEEHLKYLEELKRE
ncbi:hypothetical protein LEP1GSC193_0711 [Leptospira phage vB_LalZ_80412-LE1]|uniref:Uncharacterized protein n=1 Tax=Leptospira alstonii serovar Sichuan str. 79601 TaxID=1218565 RepID=M6CUF8_9LEPT|nr:hypothetical protein LEP1GSC193_0711 [Leptospira phage vB_LalZ_80412-LE1]EMJ95359.1 hypothetical protein LEP1GSC194_3512 [Leptospira alstonii serovar Sichuan str. 79601]